MPYATLTQLLRAGHPLIHLRTPEEADALVVLREVAVEQRISLRQWSVTRGVFDAIIDDGTTASGTEHPAAALMYAARSTQRTVTVFLDLVGHLKDERTLRCLRDFLAVAAVSGSSIVMLDAGELPPILKAYATEMELPMPGESELGDLVKAVLREQVQNRRAVVTLSNAAFSMVVKNLRGLSRRHARQLVLDTCVADARFDETDVNTLIAGKRRLLQGEGVLEYIEAPVDISQIGGLTRLKAWLGDRQHSLSDEAARFGLPAPRGILMLGVQGAGKSLSAKAVATAWGRPLLRLDPSSLYDRYVGESEKRLGDALRQAEAMSPIVLWIDEIEKGFASAASQSTDGGLSKRMFGTLLTWMQEHQAPVFLIATANDISALPPELLRKGRFDEIFFVDLPSPAARRQIFAIHLGKRKRDPAGFDLDALVAASEGFSGAEIETAIVSAMHGAFAARDELTTARLTKQLADSPPLSVTMAERMAELREWAKDRCVPAE